MRYSLLLPFLMNSQLITRLKKEVQFLKEELAIATGEQRSEGLTPHEIQRYSLHVYICTSYI